MDFLTAFLLGALQGVLEFFPVSSTGHLVFVEQITAFEAPRLLFHAFLHIGSVIAVIYVFRRDVFRLVIESGRILADVLRNMKEFIGSLLKGSDPDYIKVIRTNYRKLVVMLTAASIPTFAGGILLRGAAETLSGSVMYTGVGLLMTGIILLVSSMLRPRDEMPKDIPYWKIFVIGAAQGLSVLPGVSRFGVTLSGGILCGLGKMTAVRISFLMLIPVSLGALAEELAVSIPAGVMAGRTAGICLTGMAASAVFGILLMKRLLRFVRVRDLKGFAYYCFCAGAISVMIGFFL